METKQYVSVYVKNDYCNYFTEPAEVESLTDNESETIFGNSEYPTSTFYASSFEEACAVVEEWNTIEEQNQARNQDMELEYSLCQ